MKESPARPAPLTDDPTSAARIAPTSPEVVVGKVVTDDLAAAVDASTDENSVGSDERVVWIPDDVARAIADRYLAAQSI